ncbi:MULTISPECIES: phosphopantetheine-binding protein [Streptomyces]|uniref:acyl carrier protein n=1 Tax=Streptomyces TaxID=1883 RepID=UPI0027E4B18F|nr:phosphopantetheine-binding protein [Streptomyces sp. MW-W600-10]
MDVLKQLLLDIGIAEQTLAEIEPNTRLRADLGLSSVETTDLEIQLRERFGIRVDLWDKVDYTVEQLAVGIPGTTR